MIVNKYLVNYILFKKCLKAVNKTQIANICNRDAIGNREWVGYGKNWSAHYCDSKDFPFPAIRFKENTNELLALKEKEKGDWRKLSIEEKKTLYRASFRQTFSEIEAPTGSWKSHVGILLFLLSFGLWCFYSCAYYTTKVIKDTIGNEERRKKFLRYAIDLKIGHLSGISSKWDYEKDTWKK